MNKNALLQIQKSYFGSSVVLVQKEQTRLNQMDAIFGAFMKDRKDWGVQIPAFSDVKNKSSLKVSFEYDDRIWCGHWLSGKPFFDKYDKKTYSVLRISLPTDGFLLLPTEEYDNVKRADVPVERHRSTFDPIEIDSFRDIHTVQIFQFAQDWFGPVAEKVCIYVWIDADSQRIDIHFFYDFDHVQEFNGKSLHGVGLIIQFEVGMPIPRKVQAPGRFIIKK